MSITAPPSRLGWRILPAVLAAGAAVIAASLLIAALRDNPVAALSLGSVEVPPPAVAAGHPWDTAAFPVGMHRALDSHQRARFEIQRARVRAVTHDLIDALMLDPSTITAASRATMTSSAAKAIRRAIPLVPAHATAIEAIRRVGRIGIQAPAFKAAAAEMKVTLRATVDGRPVKWRDNITLWMERDGKTWRVLAFDVDRVPR